MKIVILGLTITSSWGNGHATTYRSLCRALHRRGHVIEFLEKDVEWYRSHRDLPAPEYCRVTYYSDWVAEGRRAAVRLAADADVVIVGSYFPDAIAATMLLSESTRAPLVFYDIDTPITLAGLRNTGSTEYLQAALVPTYDAYMSFTGGPLLEELEQRFGARMAVPLYCSVDPERYERVPVSAVYRSDLSYLGTYAPDRQPKLMRLLNATAEQMPAMQCLVAGPMYPPDTHWAQNTRWISHVPPAEHAAFYSSARFTLNLTREEMVLAGYSPSVRLFEASACGAAILSDAWPGLEEFLTPGEEIVLVADTEDVSRVLREMTDGDRTRLGARARNRILAHHTADHRAAEFECIVSRLASGCKPAHAFAQGLPAPVK